MAVRGQFHIFCGRKNSKTIGQNYFYKLIICLIRLRCASEFLKLLPEFQMATTEQFLNFLCAQKNLKTYSQKLFKFYFTFPMILRCAGDTFKVLPKFKMVNTNQLFTRKKNWWIKIIQILQIQ